MTQVDNQRCSVVKIFKFCLEGHKEERLIKNSFEKIFMHNVFLCDLIFQFEER